MARHRDIRNMDYSDDYDGYDDVYGHSVDDDFCISPSNRQFMYNRESSRDSRAEHEDDIQEVDEIDELSDTDVAKLNSCIDQIKDTLGTLPLPRNEIVNLILKYKFNIELVLNAILENSKNGKRGDSDSKDKDVRPYFNNKKFVIPKLEKSSGLHSNQKQFTVPKIFSKSPEGLKQTAGDSVTPQKKFTIPKLFDTKDKGSTASQKFLIPKLGSNNSNDAAKENFNSLADVVSDHLRNKLCIDSLKPTDSQNLSQNLSKLQLSKETQSLTSSNVSSNFSIDLSKALKTTGSLPTILKVKQNTETFDMPFIDSDAVVQADRKIRKKTPLPCTLDIRKLIGNQPHNMKKVSDLGKVICRKYRHSKTKIIYSRSNSTGKVKRFSFNTMSPDDIVSTHLQK